MASKLFDIARDAYVRRKHRSGPTWIRPLHSFAKREVATWSTWFPMSPERRLWLYRNGFLSRCGVIYDLDESTVSSYLSDYERELTARINHPWEIAVDNKLFFHCVLATVPGFQDMLMDIHGIVNHDRFHSLEGLTKSDVAETVVRRGDGGIPDRPDGKPSEPVGDWLASHLSNGDSVILKPVSGGGGAGVRRCSRDGAALLVDGESQPPERVPSVLTQGSHYLVCEDVEQAAYADELYPTVANTIRLLTMWDYEARTPFIAAAGHRVGTSRSEPIDNWLAGGLSAPVDMDRGTLGPAAKYPFAGEVEWYDRHPDTGTRIVETQIPGWAEIKSKVLDLADTLSHIPYLGWDIVVTGDGELTIIEANNCPGATMLQVHEPLLDNPRVRQFYRHHSII